VAKLSPLQDRRRAMMKAAATRWREREGQRGAALAAMDGDGAQEADSPTRSRDYAARTQILREASRLRASGRLPIGLERKIGATLDFLENAPSEAARKAGRPVARIVASCDPKVEPVGFATGFLVAPRLLLTNWHVLPDLASARGPGANFFHERGEDGLAVGQTVEIDPDYFFLSNERLDFALVGLKPATVDGSVIADANPASVTQSPAKILVGQPVNIIQHPDGGAKTWAVQENRLLDVLDEGFLQYSTDTMGGSSGSPVFSKAWELVGLHHSGVPEMHGGKIVADDGSLWTEDMGDEHVHWIANEGVRMSAIVRALAETRIADPAQQKVLDAFLAGTTDPVEEVKQILQESASGVPPAIAAALGSAGVPCQMNFTGPVTIMVGAGAGETVAATLDVQERSIRFDPDYATREGYKPDFLGDGLTVPPPATSPALADDMVQLDGAVQVLTYHHYSLAMNRARRLPAWTAANVDYDPVNRATGGRANFGSDRWMFDPRIPAEYQLGDRDFYEPAGQADRGHVVRRQDSAWGRTPEEIEFSNSDTFHWTNCTPQHAAFNRATPPSKYELEQGLWGGLETYIQSELQHGDTRACILAGPILAKDDPTVDFGRGAIAIPVRFWKVVVVKDRSAAAPKIQSFGFIISQQDIVEKFGIEFAPGRFARYRVPLTRICSEAGILLDDSIMAAEAA